MIVQEHIEGIRGNDLAHRALRAAAMTTWRNAVTEA